MLERCALAPLGTLPRLEHLDLHGNRLTGVVQPGEVLVGYFPSLRSLDLSRNAIELEIALSPCAALSQSGGAAGGGGGAGAGVGDEYVASLIGGGGAGGGGMPGGGLEEISVWGNEVAEGMLSQATGAASAEREAAERAVAAAAGMAGTFIHTTITHLHSLFFFKPFTTNNNHVFPSAMP